VTSALKLQLACLTLLLGACTGVGLLAEYRELARVLGPYLYRPSRSWSPYFPDDIWQRWARRFLD